MSDLPEPAAKALEAFATEAAASAVATDKQGQFPVAVAKSFLASGLAGLMSARDFGDSGAGLRQASAVVERVARACGSTAMIVTMHYSGVSVIEAFASPDVRKSVASGHALTTLAFSEAGSRSHFWAPVSTARREGIEIVLDAKKSWVTSANHAGLFVWSSQGTSGQGGSIWLVSRETAGIASAAPFDGLGLRGND